MRHLNIKQIMLLVGMGGMFFLYQNCGQQMSFQESWESMYLKNGEMIVIDDPIGNDPADSWVVPVDDERVSNNENPNDGEYADNDNDNKTSISNDVVHNPGKKPLAEENQKPENSGILESSNDDSLYYRCVVAGPGKSHHIGFISDMAVVDEDTPDTLCMSKKACLEIMPSVFDVKEAKFTGYCKNDKAHTFRITDAQAIYLCNKASQGQ